MTPCNMLRPGCQKIATTLLLTLDYDKNEHLNPCCDRCLHMMHVYEKDTILEFIPIGEEKETV